MKFLFETFQTKDILDDVNKQINIITNRQYTVASLKYVWIVLEYAKTLPHEFNIHEMISERLPDFDSYSKVFDDLTSQIPSIESFEMISDWVKLSLNYNSAI